MSMLPNAALTGCFATSWEYTGMVHLNPGNSDTERLGHVVEVAVFFRDVSWLRLVPSKRHMLEA